MKKVAFFTPLLLLFFTILNVNSQTILNVGDLAVLKIQTDSPDDFNFITFVDIDAGTKIYFTDCGVNSSGVFASNAAFEPFDATACNEYVNLYTVPSGGLSAGDIVEYEAGGNSDFSVYSDSGIPKVGSPLLSSGGDQITIFQDNDGDGGLEPGRNPKYIFIAHTSSTGFTGNPFNSTRESSLPPGLSNITSPPSAVGLGAGSGVQDEWDNAVYNGTYDFSGSGGLAAAKLAMTNPANFAKSNSINDATYSAAVDDIPAETTTVAACSEPEQPTVSVIDNVVTSGTPIVLTMTGALNDATEWKAYTGACAGSLAGTSAVNGNTITVTPGDGITTYYVRGEGGCTTPATCGTVIVYAQGTISSTYTGGVWNNGTPNRAYNVTFNDDYTAPSKINVYNMTVNSDKLVNLNGNNLSVTNDLILESGAALLDDGPLTTIGGTQSLKRFMNADALSDFHLMSVPVSNGDYEDSFQGSYAYRYVGAEYNNIYSFTDGAVMVPGEGVAMSGNGSATERTYTGTFNKNLVDYDLISTDEWHFLGNPYPAPISLSTFYNTNNTTVRPTFYLFNESTGAYDTWNTSLNAGTGSATANVGVAQGFFAEELTASASQVTFVGAMRTAATNTFLRTAQNTNDGILKLALNNTETMLAWNANASKDTDINDATYLQGTAVSGVYSLLNEKAHAIQAINNEFVSTIIPLGFYTLEGGVNTIAIADFSAGENIDVILIDRYESTTHDLNLAAYEFVSEISEEMIDDRFEIVLAKSSLSANENEALQSGVIVSGGSALNVISENTLNKVRVYDITGALVYEANNVNSNNFRWEAGQSNAIYLVEVTTDVFTSNHKVLLK